MAPPLSPPLPSFTVPPPPSSPLPLFTVPPFLCPLTPLPLRPSSLHSPFLKLQFKNWHVTADHYWWADEPDSENHFHPHERAPRCLPCHWTQEDEDQSLNSDGYQPFDGLPACPCTAEHICRHDGRGFFDESCNMPVHPHRAYR